VARDDRAEGRVSTTPTRAVIDERALEDAHASDVADAAQSPREQPVEARPLAAEPATIWASGGRPSQRLVAAIASAGSWLFERLPDRLLHRLAAIAGIGLYVCWRRRRRLVRGNLRHICVWLAENGRATPVVATAARSRFALERLVIGAFGHYLRYYVEVALAPSYDVEYLRERLSIQSADVVGEALAPSPNGGGRIFVGLHLGGIELPGLYAVHNARVPITAPMEAIPNAPLQQYLVRRRGAIGVRIISVEGARHALLRALARGEIAGVIADRDLTGDGHPVTLFGAPTRLPAGPGLLAISSGVPTYVAAARRTGFGTYALRGIRIDPPTEGRMRDRLGAFMEQEVRAFEDLVADAPEQWWTIFFPIWPGGFARAEQSAQAPA
jgi:lauroyl/myristoyl acyltransferase